MKRATKFYQGRSIFYSRLLDFEVAFFLVDGDGVGIKDVVVVVVFKNVFPDKK